VEQGQTAQTLTDLAEEGIEAGSIAELRRSIRHGSGRAGAGTMAGSTFGTVEIEPHEYAAMNFDEFVTRMRAETARQREAVSGYYEGLTTRNARWANGARGLLAALGTLAFLLTGVAAAIRFEPNWLPEFMRGSDKGLLVVVLLVYAAMGSISFYDRAAGRTASYFRHLGIIFAVRDLWTTFQFAILKETLALKASSGAETDSTARERVNALAQAFCSDLNKASSGEFGEWRTDFIAALKALEAASKAGTEDVSQRLRSIAEEAERQASEAKAAAEAARSAAKAVAPAEPGFINVRIVSDFDEEVVVSVDGTVRVASRGSELVLERVPPGPRTIAASATQGGIGKGAARAIDVRPGIQDLEIELK
jgi:hypothetical protein